MLLSGFWPFLKYCDKVICCFCGSSRRSVRYSSIAAICFFFFHIDRVHTVGICLHFLGPSQQTAKCRTRGRVRVREGGREMTFRSLQLSFWAQGNEKGCLQHTIWDLTDTTMWWGHGWGGRGGGGGGDQCMCASVYSGERNCNCKDVKPIILSTPTLFTLAQTNLEMHVVSWLATWI